jgi:hypothetical protein
MNRDPHDKKPAEEQDDAEDLVRNALSGFNAEALVDDPDNLDPHEKLEPAATPDSPNPI